MGRAGLMDRLPCARGHGLHELSLPGECALRPEADCARLSPACPLLAQACSSSPGIDRPLPLHSGSPFQTDCGHSSPHGRHRLTTLQLDELETAKRPFKGVHFRLSFTQISIEPRPVAILIGSRRNTRFTEENAGQRGVEKWVDLVRISKLPTALTRSG